MQLFFQFMYLYVAQDENGYLSCVSNWISLNVMIVLFTCILLLA